MVKHVTNHIQTLDEFKNFEASEPNMRWIRSAHVQAKHELSSEEKTVIVIKNLFNGKDLGMKISRGELEEMIADKLEQTIDKV